jgi:UDP-N-acetylmuramoylalanine--D-glutamate ligase
VISEEDIKTLIIHGFGVEGRAALLHWHTRLDGNIVIIDKPTSLAKVALEDVPHERIRLMTEDDVLDAAPFAAENTLYLRSPGVPPTNAVFEKMQSSGIFHTTPTGYWLATHTPDRLVTITGTKGKSSTTDLTVQLLQWAGRDAVALGNIGVTPFEADIRPDTICIVELSSYMMHDLPQLKGFHCVTSLYQEHTDWHGDFSAYAAAKLRPFSWHPPADGLMAEAIAEQLTAEATPPDFFENTVPLDGSTLQLSDDIFVPTRQLNEAFAAPSLLLALRAAAAICLSQNFLTATELKATLEEHLPGWAGLPSRQEIIPTRDGRLWVNDALATVPEATLSALARFGKQDVHLLLGGQDRGQLFTALLQHCADLPAAHVYAFGQTSQKVQEAAQQAELTHRLHVSDTLEDAITTASNNAQDGATLLFSPAAPSGPPHSNYQQRARIFRDFATAAHRPH